MRYSNFADRNPDPFLRCLGLCFDLGPISDPTRHGHLARIFVDTGANINTSNFYDMLVRQGLKSKLTKGAKDGIDVKLVGNQSMKVSGDKFRFEVDVGTNMGRISSEREFLILDNDGEPWLWGPMA